MSIKNLPNYNFYQSENVSNVLLTLTTVSLLAQNKNNYQLTRTSKHFNDVVF